MLLKERGGERVLPICVGAHEGDLLAARLREWSHPRPMGPDLTARLLEAGGVRVERVVIERLHGMTYLATVTVTAAGEAQEVRIGEAAQEGWRSLSPSSSARSRS